MASKAERKYATTISTVIAVTDKMQSEYKDKCGQQQEKLKERLAKLNEASWKYLRVANKNFKRNDIKIVADKMDYMVENGLESVGSYRSYLAYIIGLLSERETELLQHNPKSEKIGILRQLHDEVLAVWKYYACRGRRDDFDVEGLNLLNTFNECFG